MVSSRTKLLRGAIITLVLCLGLTLAAMLFSDSLMSNTKLNRAKMLESAVRRAALTCYAVEGRYPLSLEYLAENYGLIYADSSFIVVYDAFATNVFPDIHVLEKGAG